MPKTVKYVGTQDRWPELSITGKQSVWRIGQIDSRDDAEATLLVRTGLFDDLSDDALTREQAAAAQALVSNASRAAQPLRDAGVRAADSATLTAQNTWLGTGSSFGWIHAFASLSSDGPNWATSRTNVDTVIARFAGQNRETKWAFPICSAAEPITETIAGKHDAVILSMARAIVANAPSGARYIDIRPGWEPNFSTSFPWGSTLVTTAQYIEAFRKVVDLLRSVDPRIRIGFCPAYRVDAAWPWTEMYPGDAYVDLITPDVYCLIADRGALGVANDTDHAEAMFSGVCGINVFRDFARARGKRLGFAEWGLDHDNPVFIERMADFIRTNDVEFHGYWDQNNGSFQCKLSSDQYPNAAMAFVRNFGSFSIDTWGISATPGQRLRGRVIASKPIQRIEITSGNTGGVSVDGLDIVAEPQISGSRRVTVRAWDERGQSATRSIVLTWQLGRLWTPAELGASLSDWYSMDLHGTVSRHNAAIKSLATLSLTTRLASAPTSTQRPTYSYSTAGVPRASLDGGDALVQTDVTGVPAAQAAVTYCMQLYTDPAASNFTYIVCDTDGGAGVRAVGHNGGNLRIGATGGYAGGSITGADKSIVVSFGAGASAAGRGSIDGAAPAINTVAMPAGALTRRIIGAYGGAANAVGSYYLGALSELFVANVAMSAGQEDQAHGYLCWKYGRESALPGGHAYKSNPPMAT